MSKDSERVEEGNQMEIYVKRFVDRRKSADAKVLGRKSNWQV